MKKFCVFCGKFPEKKNKEHVLPRWLIEYTGDPKRNISLGLRWDSAEPGMRTFPFNHFTVPACTECNHEHSDLEGKAKAIVTRLFSSTPVGNTEVNILLDWFDKIRVGLWLAMHYLNKNYLEINPHFHINTRVGVYDRSLFVYKAKNFRDGVNFPGIGMPTFQFSPNCFSLRIKDVIFFNSSAYALVSRRIGFPYPRAISLTEDGDLSVSDYSEPRERFTLPIIQWPYDLNCIEIYQPIFNHKLFRKGSEDLANYFDNDYVKENSLNYEKGLGAIFIKPFGKALRRLDDSISLDIPQKYELSDLLNLIAKQTLNHQIRYLESTDTAELPKETKRSVKKQYDMAKYFTRKMMSMLD